MTTAPELAERYGAPAPWRGRTLKATVVVVVVAFAVWLAWTVWEQSRPVVASEMLGFTIDDANHATARIQIEFRGSDVHATCTLKAYAADHTPVGELAFDPDENAPGNVYTQTINTDRQATSVESVGCTADGQGRPR